jgi:hypothetical protein
VHRPFRRRAGHGTPAGAAVDRQFQPLAGGADLADRAVAYSCPMATKSDPAELGDVEPLADHTARQARRVVAAYATDADECRVFLSMLGIGPAKQEA